MTATTRATAAPRRLPLLGLLAAHGISLFGNSLTAIALPWFVLETTGSAARVGTVAFAGAVPLVLAAFFGGVVVDRMGHRRASVAADVLSMLTIAAVPLLYALDRLPFAALLALAALGALLDAPGATARESLLPEAIRAAGTRPEKANATFEMLAGVATLVGPALAGVLVALIGPVNVLWVNAGTFAVSALLVRFAVPDVAERRAPAAPYAAALLEGLRWTLSDRLVRAVVGYATVLTLVVAPLFSVVMPVYMRDVEGSAVGLGLFISALGGGTLVGALGYGAVGHRAPGRALFAGGLLGIGLTFVALALLPPLPVIVAAAFLGGVAAGPLNPLLNTVLQARVPAALRGRVFGTVGALGMASAPVGILAASPLLEAFGVRATLTVIAAATVAVALYSAFDRSLRELDAHPADASAAASEGCTDSSGAPREEGSPTRVA